VTLHDPPDDGEPEAGPRFGVRGRVRAAVELVEEGAEVVLGDPDAGVGAGEDRPTVLRPGAEPHGAAAGGVLDAVADHVGEQPEHVVALAEHLDRPADALGVEGDLAARRLDRQQVADLLDERAEVER
jgi:hypothetical protein